MQSPTSDSIAAGFTFYGSVLTSICHLPSSIRGMKATILFVLTLVCATFVVAPSLHAQASLDKTTFGKSQNDDRDLVNSLVPGAEKYGRGEKKSQVSAAELKSKTVKDSTFGGSLLNMGIDASAPKIDESKLRHATTGPDTASAASKQSSAGTEKQSAAVAPQPAAIEKAPDAGSHGAENDEHAFSNLSMTATLADSLTQEDKAAEEAKSLPSVGDSHNKDQSASKTGEKTTGSSPDKSSDTKPDH